MHITSERLENNDGREENMITTVKWKVIYWLSMVIFTFGLKVRDVINANIFKMMKNKANITIVIK